ncbi:CocE/NonD family hydrolase [Streptomyces sp. H27-S2]|uniref:S15 peptidase family protein n=1 Tax=Streptomyces antarcticus TaxID=2996458 RepID=UPI00227196E8|nr:CocE/NonD family hydrolase [Streptomyces sp. H27-S2]MCY0954783.1 CocE/NonD family hydrolase [Streptomyces sp. H27-S2]
MRGRAGRSAGSSQETDTRPGTATGRIGTLVAAALLAVAVCPPAGAAATEGTGSGPAAAAGEGGEAEAQVSVTGDTVRAADGTPLAATVYRSAAPGRLPLVVVPGPWFSLPADTLAAAARMRSLAARGYTVVAYDPRGFRRSGGFADLAGPRDTADVSRVIDWALAHAGADPGRVGVMGASYGAGIALNAAARDPRIRAVSSLSGWADLTGGYYLNGTRSASIALFQDVMGRLHGRYSPESAAILRRARTTGIDESAPEALQRSPRAHADQLNRNRTAVFLTNEWDDPLVPAWQTGTFFDALTGPRQLRMYPGGHGDSSSATNGLLEGGPPAWREAVAWLDDHVRDARNPLPPSGQASRLVVHSRTGGPAEEYPDWRSLQHGLRPVPLEPGSEDGRILAGLPSAAESGPFPLAGTLDQLGLPPTTLAPLLDSPACAVWRSAPLTRASALRGVARVEGVLIPGATEGTVIGYVYDVDPLGTARLLTHAPYTFRGQAPGRPHPFSLAMLATAWDLPAGHRLAVAFDTVDHRYVSENPTGAVMTVVASAVRLSAPLTPVPER